MAAKLFAHQKKNNPIYAHWCSNFGNTTPYTFLPIGFFKSHSVLCEPHGPILTNFFSSGTTSSTPSTHAITNLNTYQASFTKNFEMQYGNIEQYCIIGLLPNYLERSGSSLVYMVDYMIRSGKTNSGFYLNQYEEVLSIISENEINKISTLLIGVTFALLEMAEKMKQRILNQSVALDYTIIMETGGMKGRGKELTRTQVHQQLKAAFGVKEIHSEYGMTELLSQAYAPKNGWFKCPPWMKIFIQDTTDPKTFLGDEKTGRICVVDLANQHSCAFIATDDLGKTHPNGSFEVLGRIDFSDTRGCGQLVL